MTKIFVGFLFALLDFNIHLGSATLGLLPSFVGSILMLLGTQELQAESERYPKLRPWLLGISIYSGIVWVMNLLGKNGNVLAQLLSFVSVGIMLYITYQIVMGFVDIEKLHGVNINAAQTIAMWKVNAAMQVLCVVLCWIPIINVVLLIALVVVVILLLMAVYRTKKLYAETVQTTVSQGPEL